MTDLIKNITDLLHSNQLLTGGLGVLIGGSALAIFWRGYGYLIRLLNYLFFVEINFTSMDDSFLPVQAWLFNQKYTKKRCSHLMVKNIKKYRNDIDSTLESEQQIFIPAYGKHYFLYGMRPCALNFYKTEERQASHHITEYISLRIFCLFFKLKYAESIVKLTYQDYNKDEYTDTHIFTCQDRYGGWRQTIKKKIRQSPILASNNEYQELINDITRFLNNEKWYSERGINYKRGFLFTGPPGGGKTSCILSLAQHFKKHIYMLNLSSDEITDASFTDLISTLPKDAFLAIEDLGNKKDESKKKTKTITISTILNVLDGLMTPDKLIFFITTNHPENIDDALKRPGRIDIVKEFNNSNTYQCRTIFRRFLPDADTSQENQFVTNMLNKPMSLLENELIKLSK